MLNGHINKIKRSLLFVIFALSIVVSHYGLSYLFVMFLVGVVIISILVSKPNFGNKHFSNLRKNPIMNINTTFTFLFIVFALAWYIYVSGESNFQSLLHISNNVISNLSDLF